MDAVQRPLDDWLKKMSRQTLYTAVLTAMLFALFVSAIQLPMLNWLMHQHLAAANLTDFHHCVVINSTTPHHHTLAIVSAMSAPSSVL